MTVALVLAGTWARTTPAAAADAGGQLAALGVRRVDVAGADRTWPADRRRRRARPVNARSSAPAHDTVPGPVLARLLGAGGTAAFTRLTARTCPARLRAHPRLISGAPAAVRGAWSVDPPDLDARWPGPPKRWRPPQAARARRGRRADQRARPPRRHGPDPRRRAGQRGRRHPADSPTRPPATWPAGRPGAASPRPRSTGSRSASACRRGLVRPSWIGHAKLLRSSWRWLSRSCSPDRFAGRRDQPRGADPARVVGWLGDRLRAADRARALYAALVASAGLGASARLLTARFGSALRNTFVATWGGAGRDGAWRLAIAAPAPAGRAQAGRARLRAHRRGRRGTCSPVRAAHRWSRPSPSRLTSGTR